MNECISDSPSPLKIVCTGHIVNIKYFEQVFASIITQNGHEKRKRNSETKKLMSASNLNHVITNTKEDLLFRLFFLVFM